MLIDRVRNYIDTHHLIRTGELILVGVSGGPDSVFLLTALSRIIDSYGGSLHVIHLDHCLRGEESAADAVFVEKIASSMDLPCTVAKRSVLDLTSRGQSLQERARAVRMSFFHEMRSELGADGIALGHTADDQAETVMMRLMSGGSPGSLAGIRPRGPDGIIHPILEISRDEIVSFLSSEGISYRIDKSNLESKYLRNRVRHEIIPLIKKINPSIQRRLLTLCSLLADDDDYLDNEARRVLEKTSAAIPGRPVEFRLESIATLPRPILRRVMVEAARRAGIPRKQFQASHVESILGIISGPTGKTISLPGEYIAYKTSRTLVIRRRPLPHPPDFEKPVALPGKTGIPELGLTIAAVSMEPEEIDSPLCPPETAFVDADKLTGPLKVRLRRPGDRFYPIGFGHVKKLKDFLIDLKIDRRLRDNLPILCDDEKIVWIGGVRLDDRVKITPSTRKIWRLDLAPMKKATV